MDENPENPDEAEPGSVQPEAEQTTKRWKRVLVAVGSAAVVVGAFIAVVLSLDDDENGHQGIDEDEDEDEDYWSSEGLNSGCDEDCLYLKGDIYCPECHRGS